MWALAVRTVDVVLAFICGVGEMIGHAAVSAYLLEGTRSFSRMKMFILKTLGTAGGIWVVNFGFYYIVF